MILVAVTLLSVCLTQVHSFIPDSIPTPPTPGFNREEFAKERYNSNMLDPEKSKMAFHAMVWKLCNDTEGPREFHEMQERAIHNKRMYDTFLEAISAAYLEDVPGETLGSREWWEKLPVICSQTDSVRSQKLAEMTRIFSIPFSEENCEETEMEPRPKICKAFDGVIGDAVLMMDDCECRGCCPKSSLGKTFSGRPCPKELNGENCDYDPGLWDTMPTM